MGLDWTNGELADGLRLYEAGHYFEAHEFWEAVWLRSAEPEKAFLQGVIQVTAAMHHLRRENRLGATRLLHAALRKIEPHGMAFGGLAAGELCEDIRDRLQRLANGEAAGGIAPPRIVPLASGWQVRRE